MTLLIEAGADVLHRDRNGDTALDWAIKGLGGEDPKRILKIVSVLVRAGADGPKALESVRMQRWRGEKYLVDELADMLYEAGAANPRRLASIGDYHYLRVRFIDTIIVETMSMNHTNLPI